MVTSIRKVSSGKLLGLRHRLQQRLQSQMPLTKDRLLQQASGLQAAEAHFSEAWRCPCRRRLHAHCCGLYPHVRHLGSLYTAITRKKQTSGKLSASLRPVQCVVIASDGC